MASPMLVQYPFHKTSDTALRDEYAIFLGDPGLAEVATLHDLIKTRPLPANICAIQVMHHGRFRESSSELIL